MHGKRQVPSPPHRNPYCQHQLPFILLSILLTSFSGRSELPNQVLNQFLAGQIAPDRHEFGEIRMTRAVFRSGYKSSERRSNPKSAMSLFPIFRTAPGCFLDTPQPVPVALEILNQWVSEIYIIIHQWIMHTNVSY